VGRGGVIVLAGERFSFNIYYAKINKEFNCTMIFLPHLVTLEI